MVSDPIGLQRRGANVNKCLETAIEAVIVAAMDAVMDKVLRQDPFDMEEATPRHTIAHRLGAGGHIQGFALRAALRYTVRQRLGEAAAVIGEKTFGYGANQHMIVGRVRQGCLDRIQRTLDDLEHKGPDGKRTPPNWRKELQHVQSGAGPRQDVSVNCDVYVSESSELPGLAFELKAPLPNSDQTKVSKEKLLKLHCMEPRRVKQAYFALPYNPYGRRECYSWSFPGRWFNMREDPCVLIGDELWDKLGGKKNYEVIVEIANRVGQRYKRRIYEDYLGIPVPHEPT